MTVPFQNIPSNLRVPLFYAEVNNSQANTNQVNQRALLIGSMITSGSLEGSATPNTAVQIASVTGAKQQFGQGSVLANMAWAYRQSDPFGEVWGLPLADSGTAATGNIVFTGPATAAGALSLYIAGQLVSVNVTNGMTSAQLATATVAAIAALTDLPVTAAVDGSNTSKVDLTAKSASATGNDIDIRLNYGGTAAGQATPAGISATITAMSGGATNPTLTTALANLANLPFDFIACAYNDSTSMAALTAFLNDTAGRWSWETQLYGHYFVAYRGTNSALGTWGETLNDQHSTAMGIYGSPSPVWNWAASLTGAVAVAARADPGQPLQTVVLGGVLAPPVAQQFSLSQQNALLYDGISTYNCSPAGVVSIQRLITTYQLNLLGQPDDSYLEVETMMLLMYVLRALAAVVNTKYARVKLAADGTRFAPGSNIVTPSIIKADLVAQYQALEYGGYVQQSDVFADNLVVQINATNPNRVDVLYPAILIEQLTTFAVLLQFRLD